jgi:hypothetical protein
MTDPRGEFNLANGRFDREEMSSEPQTTQEPRTLSGMIAAIYGSLDAEDCAAVDREWARMRGYILPTDGGEVVSDIVERLREMVRDRLQGWHDPGICAELNGAADEIERLRKGIRDYLDGNFGPDFPTKHDTCPHGKFGWEDCGNCIDEYFSRLLGETDTLTPAQPHASEKTGDGQ